MQPELIGPSLLDKILAVEPGGTVFLTSHEICHLIDVLARSVGPGVIEIFWELAYTGSCSLLGRRIERLAA